MYVKHNLYCQLKLSNFFAVNIWCWNCHQNKPIIGRLTRSLLKQRVTLTVMRPKYPSRFKALAFVGGHRGFTVRQVGHLILWTFTHWFCLRLWVVIWSTNNNIIVMNLNAVKMQNYFFWIWTICWILLKWLFLLTVTIKTFMRIMTNNHFISSTRRGLGKVRLESSEHFKANHNYIEHKIDQKSAFPSFDISILAQFV